VLGAGSEEIVENHLRTFKTQWPSNILINLNSPIMYLPQMRTLCEDLSVAWGDVGHEKMFSNLISDFDSSSDPIPSMKLMRD
jgi:hypothetical protein